MAKIDCGGFKIGIIQDELKLLKYSEPIHVHRMHLSNLQTVNNDEISVMEDKEEKALKVSRR